MKSPFFSIIIPTRNRYSTLPYAIKTVMLQDFEDFELIISDNSSPNQYMKPGDIHEFHTDSRIKCLRPENELSMTDNWEFAIARSTGQYVILFGDDDGLVKGALTIIHGIIQLTNAPVLNWARVEYNWPDRLPVEIANQMVIPYKAVTGMMSSESYIRKVINYQADYRYLPMFYNSAVSRTLIETLRQKTGRVFNATIPDIYSGFALAHVSNRYLTIAYPFSINGVSGQSNGAAHESNKKEKKEEFLKLYDQSGIKWPAVIPEMYTSYLGILEPYVQLTRFFPELLKNIPEKKMYKIIIDNIDGNSKEDITVKISKILQTVERDKPLFNWVKGYIQKTNPQYKSIAFTSVKEKVGFDGSHLILNASDFDLNNVYDVSIFIAKLFGKYKDRDFTRDAFPPLKKRIRKAAAIILRGI